MRTSGSVALLDAASLAHSCVGKQALRPRESARHCHGRINYECPDMNVWSI